MSGRYLPPHLRNQTASSSTTPPRDPSDGYTVEEIAHQFDCKHKPGTLNSNSEKGVDRDGSSLAFIIVFKDQHPQWPPKLFCKTNLNLLPASTSTILDGGGQNGKKKKKDVDADDNDGAAAPPQDGEKHTHPPIPLFTEHPHPHLQSHHIREKRYIYTSHHRITRVTYLEPQSKELLRMLDTKFSPEGKRRSKEAWMHSLGIRWAIVELEAVGEEEGRGLGLGCPMVPLREVKGLGVRERLEMLRLGEGGGSAVGGGREGGKEGGGEGDGANGAGAGKANGGGVATELNEDINP